MFAMVVKGGGACVPVGNVRGGKCPVTQVPVRPVFRDGRGAARRGPPAAPGRALTVCHRGDAADTAT